MVDEGDAGERSGYAFDQVVGANIRRYREARDLSQADLAERLGVHQQTVQKIEKGTRALRHSEAVRIADVLQVPLYELTARDHAGAIAAESIKYSRRFSGLRLQLSELATEIADALIDLALVSGHIEREFADEDVGIVAADAWLNQNWGRMLNRQIMSALRSNEFLADIREEFDADSYAEVVRRVKEYPTQVHPSQSRAPIEEALKWRRLKPDESET